ncbi:MAG: DUF1127 domain-containing protein [Rhizobiales bacterium 65-9]|nr:DUF1127 domain-containing protein [Hyphomicrobiales bacterium]OJY37692.1 MAG: DUF1127 domain-containing protein [Rhizobiales bacterium 65-9]
MNIIRKINEWTRYRRTLRELGTLNARELADIGVQRHDIRRIAREVAMF